MTLQQAFELARQHHQSGRLAEAETLYRQILAVEPRHADALHLLGVIAHQVGRHDVAVELIRQAIALVPGVPDYHSNLGIALSESGKLDEAIAAYRQALALRPDFSEALNSLGDAMRAKGQLDEAIAAHRQAIALKPDYAEACSNLGIALLEKGQPDEAIAAYRQAIALKPDFSEAHCNLGTALKDHGQLDAAIASYRQAIALKPDYAEAHSNLGAALRDKGQFEEAIAACRRAIALKPNYPTAHYNLGNALNDKGHLDEAIAAYRQAIAFKPNDPEAHNNLGNALKDQGQLDEAIAAYHAASALQPNLPVPHSNRLLTLNYHPSFEAQAIAEEHRRWNRQHAESLRPCLQPHPNHPDPERRLRVGYVSPDFREHSVAFFLEPLLTSHDPAQVEVFCYANVARPDAVTARLRQRVPHWREIFGRPDAPVAELIRHDQIDLLVDLAGHTGDNRLLVFARRPAPVQVTWLGYPNTTGLDTIGYRLTDAWADPVGLTELHCSEKLIRLAPCAWCFAPGASPPVTARREGPLTFGCFNTLAKVNEPMLQLWARILQAVPDSRLLLKSAGLDSAISRQRLEQGLGELGIAPGRIELRGFEGALGHHLALYERMDIALDTFPYHGTTTTCEALWMGVPVVTLAGKTHVSRVGVSLLHNAGLPELIAESPEDYLRLATELASDLPRLEELRRTLRPRMAASPLMDAPRFARDIEAAYRAMWRAWCEQQPSHFPAP